MDLDSPLYFPTEYGPMVQVAFRYQLFFDSMQTPYHRFPEWIVAQRWILARLRSQHLNDLGMLAAAAQDFELQPGPEKMASPMKYCLAELWGVDQIFPWFSGLLGDEAQIPKISALLARTWSVATTRACLAGLVLMDSAAAAEACIKALETHQHCSYYDLEAEIRFALAVIDSRMNTNFTMMTGSKPVAPKRRLGRAIGIGNIIRAGIPVGNRMMFQRQLEHLLDLSTPYDQYPASISGLFPTKRFQGWEDLANLNKQKDGESLMVRTMVAKHYKENGLASARKHSAFWPRRSDVPRELPLTEAVQKFAGRGWDAVSISELLQSIRLNHPTLDLETALELDLHLRLPLGVVEAIFENLIAQYPHYHDYYHRFAVQLLLRSNVCDARAAALYAQGDALRAQWKYQWVAGFEIPMMELTVPETENHPNALPPFA